MKETATNNLIALLKALEVQDIEKLLQCDEEVFEAIGLEIARAIKRLKTEKIKAAEWTNTAEKEVIRLVQVNNCLQADLAQSRRVVELAVQTVFNLRAGQLVTVSSTRMKLQIDLYHAQAKKELEDAPA